MHFRARRIFEATGLVAIFVLGQQVSAQPFASPAISVAAPRLGSRTALPAILGPNKSISTPPSKRSGRLMGAQEMKGSGGALGGSRHGPMGGSPPCRPGQTVSGIPASCM